MALSWWMRTVSKVLSHTHIDIQKHYRALRRLARLVSPRPILARSRWKDFTVTAEDGYDIPVRLYKPERQGDFPLIVYFHGGGWVLGNLDSYDKICNTMAAQTQYAVLSVHYRRAPEHRFPRALYDCYSVARAAVMDGIVPGANPDNILLAGDSAGGNLACALSLLIRDRGEFCVNRQIMLYASTDNDYSPSSPYESVRKYGEDYFLTAERIQQFGDMYRSSEEEKQNPYFAPMKCADLSNQPKSLIITAEYDPLRDEAEAYGQALRDAGNDATVCRIPDALHGFLSLPTKHVQVQTCYNAIRAFLAADYKKN